MYDSVKCSSSSSSHQVELLQVVSEDGVFDGHKHEADVFRVGGAGEVGVQRLLLVRVLFLVHFQDEFLSCTRILLRSCGIRGRALKNQTPDLLTADDDDGPKAPTCELWEVGGQVRVHDLLLEDVRLVEEEDDGGALEPGVGYDGFEQGLALLHTVLKRN